MLVEECWCVFVFFVVDVCARIVCICYCVDCQKQPLNYVYKD